MIGMLGALCATTVAATGLVQYPLRHDGQDRVYLVHVPESYRAGTPAPLVMALHGGGGSMNFQAKPMT